MQEKRQANPKELLGIFPLCNMSRDELALFCKINQIKVAKRGKVLLEIGQQDSKTLFLLHGCVDLEDAQGNTYSISENSPESHRPISYKNPHPSKVVARTPVEYLRVENSIINNLLDKKPITEHLIADGQNALLERISHDLEKDCLVLPANPNVAQNLQICLSGDTKIADLEKLVAADPALASVIVKAANSVLFRCASRRITSIQHAIIRMGLNNVSFLVKTYLIKKVFTSQTPELKKRSMSLWVHAADVAATAYVLAEKLLKFDPDTASLSGLLHNIGALPIIAYAEAFPQLCQDETALNEAITAYQAELAERMLKRWQFDEVLINVVRNVHNWLYHHDGPADYCDLVMIANYHVLIMEKSVNGLPPIVNLPSFIQLGMRPDSVANGIEILQAAQKRVAEIRRLFAL